MKNIGLSHPINVRIFGVQMQCSLHPMAGPLQIIDTMLLGISLPGPSPTSASSQHEGSYDD